MRLITWNILSKPSKNEMIITEEMITDVEDAVSFSFSAKLLDLFFIFLNMRSRFILKLLLGYTYFWSSYRLISTVVVSAGFFSYSLAHHGAVLKLCARNYSFKLFIGIIECLRYITLCRKAFENFSKIWVHRHSIIPINNLKL